MDTVEDFELLAQLHFEQGTSVGETVRDLRLESDGSLGLKEAYSIYLNALRKLASKGNVKAEEFLTRRGDYV